MGLGGSTRRTAVVFPACLRVAAIPWLLAPSPWYLALVTSPGPYSLTWVTDFRAAVIGPTAMMNLIRNGRCS